MKLTYTQERVLKKASADWTDLPPGIGCCNLTLKALETRKLVEIRIEPGTSHKFYCGWQWRLAPKEAS